MDKEQRFQQLLAQYGDVVYRMAFQLTAGREAEARDLTQETFLKALKYWDLDAPGSFKAWAYRLLHNLYIDGLRRRNRGSAGPAEADELLARDGREWRKIEVEAAG